MKKSRKAVFPVAGLGTRFLPATKVVQKEMLPLVDRPLIEYAVEEAIGAGIEEFVFITAPGRSALRKHFSAAPALEATVRKAGKSRILERLQASQLPEASMHFVLQEEPRGLGHAVLCAREVIGDEPFAVILPDDVIQARKSCLAQMTEYHAITGGHMIAAEEVAQDQTSNYGIIDIEHNGMPIVRARGVVEKPAPENAPSRLAIVGRYILEPSIFDALERTERSAGGEIQLTDAIAANVEANGVYGYRFQGTRFDCGSKLGFLQATVAFGLADQEVGNVFAEALGARPVPKFIAA